MTMPKTILLTGGAGFIGCNLARWILQQTPHHVINVDKLTYAGIPASLADLDEHPQYCFEQVDVVNPQQIRRLLEKHQPDWIMHLAAETHVDRSIDDPSPFIQSNIVGTYHLLDQSLHYFNQLNTAKKSDFRFHHVSTDEVYGPLDFHQSAFTETTSYQPTSPYSASKAAADHLTRAWHTTYGLPVVISNSTNNYGPFQYPEKLIPVVILNALYGKSIPVYGTGQNIRDWLYVTDHVQALMQVIENGNIGETYHIGGSNEQANVELAQKLCQILDTKHPIAKNPKLSAEQRNSLVSYSDLITLVADRPGHDLRYASSTEKIKQELGWEPRENLTTGLEKTVDWYLANQDWWLPLCQNQKPS